MMRRVTPLLAAALLCALVSCSAVGPKRASFTAMDTVMSVTVWDGDGVSSSDADACLDEAKRIVCELEAELSVTDASSAIARANAAGRVTLDARSAELCRRSLLMCERSGGALDITVYPLLRAWGFTTDQYRVPPQSEIDSLLDRTGYGRVSIGDDGTLSLDEGTMIDLGAVAKGYACDLIRDMLAERGVTSAMINLGGNVRTLGKKPDGSDWRVGIASPNGDGNACVVRLADGAVVTSGSYERFFERDGRRYCHIIDPATGYPVDGALLSVTVIGESGFECDALSTALFVMGFDGASDYWRQNGGFEMILLTDSALYATEGIAPCVESSEDARGDAVNVVKRW